MGSTSNGWQKAHQKAEPGDVMPGQCKLPSCPRRCCMRPKSARWDTLHRTSASCLPCAWSCLPAAADGACPEFRAAPVWQTGPDMYIRLARSGASCAPLAHVHSVTQPHLEARVSSKSSGTASGSGKPHLCKAVSKGEGAQRVQHACMVGHGLLVRWRRPRSQSALLKAIITSGLRSKLGHYSTLTRDDSHPTH